MGETLALVAMATRAMEKRGGRKENKTESVG